VDLTGVTKLTGTSAVKSQQVLEKEALDLLEAEKTRKMSELTREDLIDIEEGIPRKDVINKRLAFNKEQAAIAEKNANDALTARVTERTDHLMQEDPLLTPEDARRKARSLLVPDQFETATNTKLLRDNGFSDDLIVGLNPEERAGWAETLRTTKFALPALLKVESMVPQPVITKGFISSGIKPLTLLSGENLGALKGAQVSHTELPMGLASHKANVETINRLKGKVAASLKPVTPIESFASEADKVVKDSEVALGSIVASAKNPRAFINSINDIVVSGHDAITHLANKHNVTKFEREAFDNLIIRLDKKFKGLDIDENLESAAKAEWWKEVENLLPENSPDFFSRTDKKKYREALVEYNSFSPQQKVDKKFMKDWAEEYRPYFSSELRDVLKKAGVISAVAIPLVSLASLFSPDDANAASIGAAAVPREIINVIKSSSKPVASMVDAVIEAKLSSPVLTENGRGITSLMETYNFAPKDIKALPKTRLVRFLDSLGSLHTRGSYHFKSTLPDGSDGPTNPGVVLGYISEVVNANTEAGITPVLKILKDHNITSHVNEVTAEMLPFVNKYHQTIDLDIPYQVGRISMFDDILAGKYKGVKGTETSLFSHKMKYFKEDISKLDPEDKAIYDTFIAERQKAVDALESLKPIQAEFNEAIVPVYKSLASKYSTSRVALAVDGVGMDDADPWLRSILSPDEKVAVDELKDIYRVFGARMQKGGHRIIAGPYMHHPKHPNVSYQDDLKYLENLGTDGAESMRLVNFFHRSAGSKLMMPETGYVMGKYIPDAAKRIGVSEFWRMKQGDGWYDVLQKLKSSGGYDGAVKLLDDIRTAFDPMDVGTAGKWLNRYASFEVARLLTLSPSVSFKHALKLTGNWSIFPGSTMLEATPQGMNIAARGIAQDLAGESFKGKDRVADLYKALTNQSHMYAAISDMAPYEVSRNIMDQFLNKWNTYGSAAVNGVERMDRGITFAASMMMAQKRGMTPSQAIYGVLDSVLKVNFLTGPNNPKWLKDPLIRTMMMFQGTPFKILEQRSMLAYRGMKSLGKVKEEVLRQLRADVKEGEARFKYNLLKDEFMKDKDYFGTPYATQFMKQLLTIGTVVYTGKKVFDSELFHHAVHFPGIQLGERGMQLGLNPAIGAAYRTISDTARGDTDEFWLSDFFNTWLGRTGFPAIARKIARLNNNDIPAIYRENKLNYLFGVPKSHEGE
jgi:hypothetical protein